MEIVKSSQVQSIIFEMIESHPKLSSTSKSQYKKAIYRALADNVNLLNAESLQRHANTLPKSSKSFLKAALNIFLKDLTLNLKSSVTPDNLVEVQASLLRFEAIGASIEIPEQKGTKQHSWLSMDEITKIFNSVDTSTLIGKRDRIILILAFHCGLRRDEICNASFDDLVECPVGDEIRLCLNTQGKGDKLRVLPLRNELVPIIKEWEVIAGKGKLARSVTKGGDLGDDLSPNGVFKLIAKYGEIVGKPKLQPHDARRSYAQNGLDMGISLTQISQLLGHESLETTKTYLNIKVDLKRTISDVMPF